LCQGLFFHIDTPYGGLRVAVFICTREFQVLYKAFTSSLNAVAANKQIWPFRGSAQAMLCDMEVTGKLASYEAGSYFRAAVSSITHGNETVKYAQKKEWSALPALQ